ncbi:MAG TPA: hypothetical protein VFW87_00610 [Pirellulales bacterium]|nr:hypothetical protein [Pirellulales bacterium]
MKAQNQFVIQNDTPGPVILNIEPECFHYPLASGDKVTVREIFSREPLTLKVESSGGETIISMWPGDGDVRVEKHGINVLELMVKEVGLGSDQ